MSKQSTVMIIVSKWLGSTKIQAMKPDEEGAYLRLLLSASQMDDCGLPDDDNELANLSRLGNDWFKKPKLSSLTRGQRIRQCFRCEGGRLFNDRLSQDREQFEALIEKRRHAGHVSAEQRRGKNPTHVPTHDEHMLEQNGNTCTPLELRAKSLELKEASKLAVVPTGQRRSQPARHPANAIAWVQESLENYFSTLGAEPPPGKPNTELCCKIIDITGVSGLQAFQDTLTAKHQVGRKDIKTWGWFLSIAKESMLDEPSPQVDEWGGLNASSPIV